MTASARLLAGLFVGLSIGMAQGGALPLSNADQACERLSKRLQSIQLAECRHLHLMLGDGASVEARPMLYRDFRPTRPLHGPNRVLLIGGIHGDELSSVSVVFQWMRKLESEKRQPFYWRVVPSANPDGLFSNPARRINRNGVDLNRNFPSAGWATLALPYWRSNTGADPRRFPGRSALSEPETRWLTDQIAQFRPDAIVSVHAPYGVLDYDGPLDPPQRFGFLSLHPLGAYPGSLGSYAGIDLGLPVITLELPHAGALPTPAESQRVWSDMIGWLERNLPLEEPAHYQSFDGDLWLYR